MKSAQETANPNHDPSGWLAGPAPRRRIPRVEFLLLTAGLLCTLVGKFCILWRNQPVHLLSDLFYVVYSDILFFAIVILFIRLLYLIRPARWMARCVLVLAMLISIWSIFNVAWLIKSGVQLQPEVVIILLLDLRELLPLVLSHLAERPAITFLLTVLILALIILFIRWYHHPAPLNLTRSYHTRWTFIFAMVVICLVLVHPKIISNRKRSFSSEVLSFSSHWYALVSMVTDLQEAEPVLPGNRTLVRAGERTISLTQVPAAELPNVVLVLLESVSYSVTSLADPALNTTPFLAQLAAEGVEFQTTRVPVSHTTKSFWAALTATTPVIEANYIEAIPTQPGYEGLPSILGRAGCRSGFFQMSKGTFECGPGLFSNLGFDWAWFRENLEDPAAAIGLLAGDDCRMIEPALKWAGQEKEKPFLLVMITSVSHDPYDVPEWFEKEEKKEDPYDKYLQTIRFNDYFLRTLCQSLKERGLDTNTLLCVLGDHGTSFREKVDNGRWIPYEEVIRVPWVIRWPGHIGAGQAIDWPCSQMDVTPTILQLLGFDISQAGFEGKDAFVPSEADRRLYFSSWYTNSPIGFIEGSRKVVYWPYLDEVCKIDLAEDPGEKNPHNTPAAAAEDLVNEILNWKQKSQYTIPDRELAKIRLFSHWQTTCAGRSAWTYYVPEKQ